MPVGRDPGHLLGEVGRPVAVAPVDRQVQAVGREVRLDRRDQRAVLRVDRADAAEAEVVLGHLEQPLARDPAAPGDVLQERQHVVRPLRPAEGHQQERVVRRGAHRQIFASPSRRAAVGPVPYRAGVLRPYRELLATPGGLRFSSAAFVARMPIAMIGLGVVLLVVAETGRYGRAGALSATFALVNAGAAPAIARLVDRLGQRRVLLRAVPLHLVALVAFVRGRQPRRTDLGAGGDDRGGRAARRRRSARWCGPAGATCSGRIRGSAPPTRSSRCSTS